MPSLKEFQAMGQEERFALIEKHNAATATVEDEEEDRCPECGHTPETGACFYCKMD